MISHTRWFTVMLASMVGICIAASGCKNAPADKSIQAAKPSAEPDDSTPVGPTITIVGRTFQPAELQINAGTTVTWLNPEKGNHTIYSGSAASPTGPLHVRLNGDEPAGLMYSHKFDEPGEYPYYCDNHPGMKGVIIVARRGVPVSQ